MPIKTISITGPDGVGKSTAAKLIYEVLKEYGRHPKITAFGGPIYTEVAGAFQVPEDTLNQSDTKNLPNPRLAVIHCTNPQFVERMVQHFNHGTREGGIDSESLDLCAPRSPRQILRWWASEFRRTDNPMYWVNKYANEFSNLMWHNTFPVAQDLRDQLEANFTRQQGGHIWCITSTTRGSMSTKEHSTQVSGMEFNPEVVITNDGSEEALRANIFRQLHAVQLIA